MSSNLPPGCGMLPGEAESWKEAAWEHLIDQLDPIMLTETHFAALIAAAPAIVAAADAAEDAVYRRLPSERDEG